MLKALGYKSNKSKYAKVDKTTKLLEIEGEEMELEPITSFGKDTQHNIKKILGQLSNDTKLKLDSLKQIKKEQDIKNMYQYWDELNQVLDAKFPTLSDLVSYAKLSDNKEYCVINASYFKDISRRHIVDKLTLSHRRYQGTIDDVFGIVLLEHKFIVSNKKSWFEGNNYPLNLKHSAISYNYIYNYMKNKSINEIGKPVTGNTKYGLYYLW